MRTRLRLLGFALLMATACFAQAAVYRVTGADGKVTYTDQPPSSADSAKGRVKEVPIISHSGPVQQGQLANQPDWQAILKRPAAAAADKPASVVMFSTDWCGYCRQARDHMRAKGIPFTDLDVEKSASAKAEYSRLGGRGVPFFVIGKRTLAGFSAPSFDAALRDAVK